MRSTVSSVSGVFACPGCGLTAAAATAAAALLTSPAWAQDQPDVVDDAFTRLDPVAIYDSVPPDWEDWCGNLGITEEGLVPNWNMPYNVSNPTYTPYLPDAVRNTETAVVVAPGGGFRILGISHEGHRVAEYLAERGVAAFVLKYRLAQIEDFESPEEILTQQPPFQCRDPRALADPSVADALETISQIRARADEYQIDASKIGIIGFSAGSIGAAQAAIDADPAARADFSAIIYGVSAWEYDGIEIPAAASSDPLGPIFFAIAQDDPILRDTELTPGRGPKRVMTITLQLMEAGYSPELHLYRNGGHGFGMNSRGATSDLWTEQFFWWMTTLGLTQKPGDPPHEIRE